MTRRLFSLLLVLLLLAPVAARQRVAVVLSGGGAKGMGHIGALKVIEQAGLPVDIVVGTSMGALIGGLYSIGYSPGQLDSMVRCQDWKTLLSDKVDRQAQAIDDRARSSRYIVSVPLKRNLRESSLGGMISGQNLAELFATLTVGYQDSLSFDSLPTRFACVAADITTGREHVFRSGQLFTAMRASMAIPGVFTPVRLDGMVLVDGGLCNNYPVDVARRMGADIVIGVTVQSDTAKAAETLTTLPEILNQAVGIATRTKYEENVAATDVLIRIPTAGFGTASFNLAAIDTLISRGEVAAGAQLDSLFALKARLGMAPDSVTPPRPPFASLTPTSRIRVARISFTDIKEGDARMVCRKCKLREGEEASLAQIELAQSLLRTASIYSNVTYQIRQTAEGNELHFQAEERYEQTANLGVRFDNFFLESSLYTDGAVQRAVDAMIASGNTYEKDDALWLRTTTFEDLGGLKDDKDRVMRKKDGTYTYFVPDVAYHLNKFSRGYSKAVNIQGSDHHGTMARVRAGLQAAAQTLGLHIPTKFPEYILHKMLAVIMDGEPVKMSKRAGNYVTLRDLVQWAGRDAARYFLVSRKADAEFVFDVTLARQKSDENPVYYLQYAHARICSVFAGAKEKGFDVPSTECLAEVPLDSLSSEEANQLIAKIAEYPELLAQAARDHAPHLLCYYLKDLAAAFHTFYNSERFLVEDPTLRNARLALVAAARQVLRNGLALLGISAPDYMSRKDEEEADAATEN